MSNNLRTRNGLPFNFVNGIKVRGMDIESLIPGIEGIPEAGSKYQFAGNGSNKVFTLPVTPYNKDAVDVYVKQLYVHPDDYTLVGDTITLTEAPPAVVAGETYNVVVKVSLTTLNGYVNASRVSFEGENLDDILEKSKPIANYAALRAYSGSATQVRITDPGIAGFFYYDASDTTSADNGGTVIVSSNGRRWKRVFDGAISVLWFGADNEGVSDAVPAIKSAIAAVNQQGGGTVFLPSGVYSLSLTESDGFRNYHFGLTEVQGVNFIGYGARLVSAYSSTTQEAVLFYGNGARNIGFEGFEVEGIFNRTPGTSIINNYGICTFLFRSANRDSESISVKNVKSKNTYYFFGVGQPPALGYRVRSISIENCFQAGGYYGILCQNNGDNLTATNFRSFGILRTYFVYGVDTHDVQYISVGGDRLTDCLIKAYSINTRNISVRARVVGNTSNDAKCSIETQHAPSTQPVPARLININLHFDDSESSGSKSLRFAYFQDTPTPVETATTPYNLFDNITISGFARNNFDVAVSQGVYGRLNVDELIPALPGTVLFRGKGFSLFQESGTWTPVLVDGDLNQSEGQSASVAVGKYEKIGNVIYFNGRIRMSSLGSLNPTAAVTITGLPFISNPQSNISNIVSVGSASNLNMSSPIALTGVIPENTNRISVLKWTATGTVGLGISELTSVGQLTFSGSYIL